MAIQRQRPAPGLLQHSDRGSQYAADDYRRLLKAAGMRQSMSRRGNCLDNAPMESGLNNCFRLPRRRAGDGLPAGWLREERRGEPSKGP